MVCSVICKTYLYDKYIYIIRSKNNERLVNEKVE